MAGPTKKTKKVSNSESDNESMSEESESGTYHGQKEIQATFEGRNPEGNDFHGIKQLLLQLFLKASIDLSQMSDLLINQRGVGSVLKQSFGDSDDEEDVEMVDESDVFGITSVINLASHKETPCVQQFFSLLEELSSKHTDPTVQEKIKRILNDHKHLGFLINERFVNIPAKISIIMLNSLYEEVERIKKKDSTYDFEYYIMICKTCRPKDKPENEEIFSNDEEEVFSKAADISFDFNVSKESDTGLSGRWLSEDKQVIPYRRILLFKADKLKSIITQVTSFIHGQKEIQATLKGRNPEGNDFHGIKQLLLQLFLKASIDLSQMSDLLISQRGVGSVLKQSFGDSEDEEDVEMVDESVVDIRKQFEKLFLFFSKEICSFDF